MTTRLWEPSASRIAASNLTRFRHAVEDRWGVTCRDYAELHDWSVRAPSEFWASVWDHSGVVGTRGAAVVEPASTIWRTRFFPDASVNYAQNLLRRHDDGLALVGLQEDGSRRAISWRELHRLVSRLQQALRASDVGPGDRVAAWLPNIPEAVALFLATSSIGAVFSSCSPDFGVGGVIDRFGQIGPKVLCAVDGYRYDGASYDCQAKLKEIVEQLPSVRTVVVVENGLENGDDPAIGGDPARAADGSPAIAWSEWVDRSEIAVEFVSLPFDHPLYVLYSSGTTGLPKGIVHRAGGVLLKHLVEHQLQSDVRPGDRVFYFTTTGWMMWNWLASALASEATAVLYDGAPMRGRGSQLWNVAEDESITLFGTSARYLESCNKIGMRPIDTCDLSSLRTIGSTGSPLAPDEFEYVYRHVKQDVHLMSISGGTDLCGCLVGGDPTGPVWAGEIQRPCLGVAVDVVDDDGRSIEPGRAGELVCTEAFPSMPIGLWGDAGGARYEETYFRRFPGMWHQGDFAQWTEHGGIIIHGRSDATLNPGGVRIGTAEIYRQVDSIAEIEESVAIGQRWHNDVRIVLFVVLSDDAALDEALAARIRERVRVGASPRHVPARIVAVEGLPRTRSGKLSELAVRAVVHGERVQNVEALANPEVLDQFRGVAALER